jgi:hypothetical protein
MFTFDIEKYLSHYVRNAKRIAVRNFRYTSKDGALIKNNGYKDFDLLFNNKGQLLEVIHLNRRIEKSTVFYNSEKQIIKIVKSRWSNNEFLSEIDTNYDEQNRLLYEGERLNFTYSDLRYSKEIYYKYEGNIRTINMYIEDDEERYTITEILDDNGNAIETKAVEEDGELKYWLKDLFDENNKYIRTMSLNDDGTEDIRDDKPVIEDTYDEKFSNNDRNNWIVKEVYRNNILKESTERNITYF